MEENKKAGLFREKNMEAMESPESLNEYLRVTSPGIWIVLTAVIVLVAGAVLWCIFGRINTTLKVAVVCGGERAVCMVPYDELEAVMNQDTIAVQGLDLAFRTDEGSETRIVSEEMDPYIRVAGGLNIGDVVVEIPVEAGLPEGIYTGSIVTESLQPISLLIQ